MSLADRTSIAPITGAPNALLTLAPSSVEELSEILKECTADQKPVLIWGGGHHQGRGGRVAPEVIISTAGLNSITEWQSEDLTLVVEGGATLETIESHLSAQFAVLPHHPVTATVGGILASGAASYERLRIGLPRDHILGITVVTGDGRIVKAGGTVVKNVSGYDLMRLISGSFGGLGVIVEVVLKLWPKPAAKGMVATFDPATDGRKAYRPSAVLETRGGAFIYLAGTNQEIQAQATALGGQVADGHVWPSLAQTPSSWSLRVPSDRVSEAISRLPAETPYVAQHLVGEITFGADNDIEFFSSLRGWADGRGGSLVTLSGPDALYRQIDPWGPSPQGAAIGARIRQAFDPAEILNPGRFPRGT